MILLIIKWFTDEMIYWLTLTFLMFYTSNGIRYETYKEKYKNTSIIIVTDIC